MHAESRVLESHIYLPLKNQQAGTAVSCQNGAGHGGRAFKPTMVLKPQHNHSLDVMNYMHTRRDDPSETDHRQGIWRKSRESPYYFHRPRMQQHEDNLSTSHILHPSLARSFIPSLNFPRVNKIIHIYLDRRYVGEFSRSFFSQDFLIPYPLPSKCNASTRILLERRYKVDENDGLAHFYAESHAGL